MNQTPWTAGNIDGFVRLTRGAVGALLGLKRKHWEDYRMMVPTLETTTRLHITFRDTMLCLEFNLHVPIRIDVSWRDSPIK